jgi:catechol 2,3-dioxygenase-like lactoylglutathione lyase family enzyme
VAVTGPDFISLQVRDLERSAAFYEQYLGLKRSAAGPPHAVVFGTRPIAFAVRDVVAGTDLDAIGQPGLGIALWLHAPDAQDIHDALAAAGTTIISAPADGPFGRTFTFAAEPGPGLLLDGPADLPEGVGRVGRAPHPTLAQLPGKDRAYRASDWLDSYRINQHGGDAKMRILRP